MPIYVYVSPDPKAAFSPQWERVGILDTREPAINQKAAQKLQSLSGGGGVRIEFYLSADPDSRWLGAEAEHSSFGVAFDLFGDGSRVLRSERPAKVAPVATRPPEPHPGLLVKPVMVPVKVNGTLKRVGSGEEG